jgi:uncharacterized protein
MKAKVLEPHLNEIPALCERYGVSRLEIFGSATGSDFDPNQSDLDFLVDFNSDSTRLFERYFGLKDSLEALFKRNIDLVTLGALENPYFIDAINQSRELLYAVEETQAA